MGLQLIPRLLIAWCLLGFGHAVAEGSAENLQDAKKGVAEPSWPKKPGNETSSLSGKMFNTPDVAIKNYDVGKVFAAGTYTGSDTRSRIDRQPLWSSERTSREQSRMNEDYGGSAKGAGRMAGGYGRSSIYEGKEVGESKVWETRRAEGWVDRTSRKGGEESGALKMYEGRLTRVRERVSREEPLTLENLGEYQEKFTPDQVEKMLKEPRGATPRQTTEKSEPKAESPKASRPLAAGS